ncbi:hypothetical protein ILYODFUR_036039 [Ilyodon furcidens]|uniref:C2H2-type domain-containing protein n=1 Tax=Ilyodon furcidens TaxID=33524 RepID=A0ABV0TDY1_9TELE
MSVTTWKVLDDRFLITEERNSFVDHKIQNSIKIKEESEPQPTADRNEEPEPQPIKEEQVELFIFQDEGQLLVKQETNSSMAILADDEIFNSEPELQQMVERKDKPEPVEIKDEQEEPELIENKEEQGDLCNNEDGEHLVINQEAGIFMRTPGCDRKDSHDQEPNNQNLSTNRLEDENQHQQGSNQKASGSSRDKDREPEKRHQDTRNHRVNMDNSELKRHKTNLPCCEVCGKCFAKRPELNKARQHSVSMALSFLSVMNCLPDN